jgi:hypothetical protein
MKKAAVIIGGLALAGCGGGAATVVTSIFDQIQQAASALCGYRPTFDTIQAIITALGGPPIVSTVAGLFCTQARTLTAQQAPRAAGVTPSGEGVINLGTVIINGKPVTITVLR